MAEWVKTHDPRFCVQGTHFRTKDTNRLKVQGTKKIFHAKGNQKRAGLAILISNKICFKFQKDKFYEAQKGHYIWLKGSIQKDVTILSIYTSIDRPSMYIKAKIHRFEGRNKQFYNSWRLCFQ